MGVLGLTTWAELSSLGTRVQLERTEQERTVVLDACAGTLAFFGHDSLLCDFDALRANVARFVARFAAANVRLLVVVDGAVPEEKFATWMARRRKDARTVAKINARIGGGAATQLRAR